MASSGIVANSQNGQRSTPIISGRRRRRSTQMPAIEAEEHFENERNRREQAHVDGCRSYRGHGGES